MRSVRHLSFVTVPLLVGLFPLLQEPKSKPDVPTPKISSVSIPFELEGLREQLLDDTNLFYPQLPCQAHPLLPKPRLQNPGQQLSVAGRRYVTLWGRAG